MRTPIRLLFGPMVACLFATALSAQDNTELLSRMKAMEERIRALETEVQTLKSQPVAALTPQPAPAPPAAALPPQPAPTPPTAAPEAVSQVAPTPAPPPQPLAPPDTAAQAALAQTPSLGGAGAAAAKVLNPDISVIGDFVGAAGNSGGRPTPSLQMHESEVGFQAIIDPYARADFFVSFGEQGVNLEEGYLTFTSLPAGLQLKVGKMRAAFGKVNTIHNHTLSWTDRPLVTQNLVGGEDGINDAGLSLSRILPAPKGLFLEATAQVYRGDSENVFAAPNRSDLAAVGHIRGYSDLSESTNIDFGASYARGHSPYADGHNQLVGIDTTLRWKPLRRAIYRSFVARSEFIWARTSVQWPNYNLIIGNFCQSPGACFLPAPVVPQRILVKPFGFYVSGDYQLGRRWTLGGRFDRSQRGQCLPTNPETSPVCTIYDPATTPYFYPSPTPLLQDTGGSVLLTYQPSEFSLIRTQFRRTAYGEGRTANEVLFQFLFSMGAHGAHPF